MIWNWHSVFDIAPGVRYRVVFVVSGSQYLGTLLSRNTDTDTRYLKLRVSDTGHRYPKKLVIPDTGHRYPKKLVIPDTSHRYPKKLVIPDTGHRYPKKLVIPDTDTNPYLTLLIFFPKHLKLLFSVHVFKSHCNWYLTSSSSESFRLQQLNGLSSQKKKYFLTIFSREDLYFSLSFRFLITVRVWSLFILFLFFKLCESKRNFFWSKLKLIKKQQKDVSCEEEIFRHVKVARETICEAAFDTDLAWVCRRCYYW